MSAFLVANMAPLMFGALVLFLLMGFPVAFSLAANGLFFGLILPHGLLELTCLFVAAGVGLRLFWAWVSPGPRTRVRAPTGT